LNGSGECGYDSAIAGTRSDFYAKWLAFFDLEDESELGCSSQGFFPQKGSANVPSYWVKDWAKESACAPSTWETPYSIYARDDYKRCVCVEYGEGAADCAT